LRGFPLNILQDFKTLAEKREVYSARQLSAGATDFSGALPKLRKATSNFVMSVRPPVLPVRMEKLGSN
jgi:hypothetical protein